VIKEGRERVVLALSLWHRNQSTNSENVTELEKNPHMLQVLCKDSRLGEVVHVCVN